ncbi:MAG: thiamine pyrophosphate-dependent enzyme [Actinomycetota bacterium]
MSDQVLQLLTPDGKRIAPIPGADWYGDPTARNSDPAVTHPVTEQLAAHAAELSPSDLRAAYRHMVLTRAFDREATSLQRQGELGLWVPSLGQEAAQVGSAMATPAVDMVYPSYREHGVAQVRGLDLRDIIPVFRGTRHGGWDPRAQNFHLYTFVIGAHTLHAVGHAMALTQDRRRGLAGPAAVTVYFGDGATSQGDVNEALVFASSARAPVLFLLQNNQWAISVPTSTQSRTPLANRADGFGVPHLRVDGNDVVASFAATRYALTRIADDGGPFLIEFETYRMGAHTTSDDPTRYRSREEEDSWRAKDPIARLRALLTAEGAADEEFLAAVDAEAHELGASVREFTRANAAGDFPEVFDHVYATPNLQVEHERAVWDAYVRGEG